jgi:hypothetical protein
MNRWKNLIIIISITIIAFLALAAFIVKSAEPIQVEVEARFTITSRGTPLWDPGFHEFDLEGDMHLTSPVNQDLSISGNGSVMYVVTGPIPFPPGPLEGSLNFTGNIGDTTWSGLINPFQGPIDIITEFRVETTLMAYGVPPPYTREEKVFIEWIIGLLDALWDPSPFNITEGNFTVDFRTIGGTPDGTYFEIDVFGTASVIPTGEPEPIPEIPFVIGITMAAPVVAYKIRRDLIHLK